VAATQAQSNSHTNSSVASASKLVDARHIAYSIAWQHIYIHIAAAQRYLQKALAGALHHKAHAPPHTTMLFII
jgi:predicted branched-subunit amino acid permease